MQVSPHTGWLPSKIATVGGRLHVLAVRFDGESMTAPFLDVDLDRATESVLVPLDEAMQWEMPGNPQPAGFILHMSRTGSSVAGLMLRASGDVAFVGEPLSINGLFFRPHDDQDEQLLAEQVRFIIRWFVTALGARRRVVFKLPSWLSLHLERFQAWYPQVPFVFMYREPVEVVSAIVNNPPFMFRRSAMRMRYDAPPELQPDYEAAMNASVRYRVDYRRECDYVEFVARFLGVICEPAAASLSSVRPVHPVSYATFKQQVLDELAPAFGVVMDEHKRALMLEATRFDAKRGPFTELFKDDSTVKRMNATPRMVELSAQFVQPSIDLLMRSATTARAAAVPR